MLKDQHQMEECGYLKQHLQPIEQIEQAQALGTQLLQLKVEKDQAAGQIITPPVQEARTSDVLKQTQNKEDMGQVKQEKSSKELKKLQGPTISTAQSQPNKQAQQDNHSESSDANRSVISGLTVEGSSQYKTFYTFSSNLSFYCRLIYMDFWNPSKQIKMLVDQGESDKDKIKEFKRLHFKNHILLVKYLALKSHKNSFKYIAKHYFDKSSVKKHQSTGTEYALELKLEKGLAVIQKNTVQTYAHEARALCMKSQKEVKQWIIDLIERILQLQSAGIFHADLAIRNSIKIIGITKIIDFDLAFKVKIGKDQEQQQCKNAFDYTKELLRFILNYDKCSSCRGSSTTQCTCKRNIAGPSRSDCLIKNYLFRDNFKFKFL